MLNIEVVEGDISGETTAAIVNAANDHFWMGAGVAGAIKRRGGEAIEREAMAQGPVRPGECVITSGGGLAARYVIHAAVMGQDLQTSAELIDRATRNSRAIETVAGSVSAVSNALGGHRPPLQLTESFLLAPQTSHKLFMFSEDWR